MLTATQHIIVTFWLYLQHSGTVCGSDFRDVVESDEDPASVMSKSASQDGSSNGDQDGADSLRLRLQLELAKLEKANIQTDELRSHAEKWRNW